MRCSRAPGCGRVSSRCASRACGRRRPRSHRRSRREVDFLAVHVYPEAGKVDAALDYVARSRKGKPVVVEETFPLRCSPSEYVDFLRRSRNVAGGWLAHFWSLTPQDLERKTDAASVLMRESLDAFQRLDPNR